MTDPSVILLNQTDGMVDVLRRRGDRTDILARFPEVRGVEHVAAVAVLFNPADTSLPWRSGDILMARNQGRYPYGRSVIRLRRVHIGRIETWSSETVWSESASALSLRPLRSLALDPLGQLYFSAEGSRNIFRLHRSPGGSWSTGAVASVPSNVPFGGNFALAADGKLYVSSGAGVVPGSVYKSTIRFGDPPPLNPTVNLVAWGKLYLFDEQGGGAIEGFGFYDPDQLVFADGTGAFWQKKVNPRYNPAGPPPPIVPSLPTFPPPPPTLVRHEPGTSGVIHSVGPLVTAWTDYLEENTDAKTLIRWSPHVLVGSEKYVSFKDWSDHPATLTFVRQLHRFYGAAAAGESGPLSYLRELDPLTGDQRIAPARTLLDAQDSHLTRREISSRDASELMLAYLGVQLWVETARLTGHRAADLEIEVFDPRQSLFRLVSTSDGRSGYVHPEDSMADVMPNDPVPALNFMLAADLFGNTPEDTVYRIGDWMRAKLHHGVLNLRQNQYLESYGYDGKAPLTTVLEKRENILVDGTARHWAWAGCHTAAGVYTLLARLGNIPGDTPPLWENWDPAENAGQEHRGVRFSALRLRSLHADDFYWTTTLKDPRATAERVFSVGSHEYEELESFAPAVVSTQGECDASMSHYFRLVAEIGTRAAADFYLCFFWVRELIQLGFWPSLTIPCSAKWTVIPQFIAGQTKADSLPWQLAETPSDWAARVFCESTLEYVGFIEKFLEDHADDIGPGIFNDSNRLQAALNIYNQKHQDWLAKRI